MNKTVERCIYRYSNTHGLVNYNSISVQDLSKAIYTIGGLISPWIVIGNGFVIIALLRKENLRTTTNILICTLALSDCFTGLIFIPLFFVYISSSMYFDSCVLMAAVFASGWIFCGSSFLAMLFVSIERYLALFLHLKYETFATTRKAILSGFVAWVIPIFVATIYLVGYFTVAIFISILFLLPGLIVITFIYLKIFKLVKRHRLQIQTQQYNGSSMSNTTKQRKLAVTIALVVGVSFLCYLPMVLASVVAVVLNFTASAKEALGFCSFLFTISSFCNPIIYCHRNQEIRQAVLACLRDIRNWLLGTISIS